MAIIRKSCFPCAGSAVFPPAQVPGYLGGNGEALGFVYADDDFVGAADTLLSAHTPEVGVTWTEVYGTKELNGASVARNTGSFTEPSAAFQAAASDNVRIDAVHTSLNTVFDVYSLLRAVQVSASNYTGFAGSYSSGILYIIRINSFSSRTILAQQAITTPTPPYTTTFTLQGNLYTLSCEGTSVQYDDTAAFNATEIGAGFMLRTISERLDRITVSAL